LSVVYITAVQVQRLIMECELSKLSRGRRPGARCVENLHRKVKSGIAILTVFLKIIDIDEQKLD